jgi:hypothetical protein
MKRHDTDVVSLVFGLLFLAGTGWWAVNRLTDVDAPAGWPLATALLVAGAIGLLSALPRRRRNAAVVASPGDSPLEPNDSPVDSPSKQSPAEVSVAGGPTIGYPLADEPIASRSTTDTVGLPVTEDRPETQ